MKFDRWPADVSAAGHDEREVTHRSDERGVRILDGRILDGRGAIARVYVNPSGVRVIVPTPSKSVARSAIVSPFPRNCRAGRTQDGHERGAPGP